MFNKSKKGILFAIPIIWLILGAIVLSLTTVAIVTYIFTNDSPVDVPDVVIPKGCMNVEDELVCPQQDRTNMPTELAGTCNEIYQKYGVLPYFAVDLPEGKVCKDCKEYVKDNPGEVIARTWFWSKEECDANRLVPNPPCLSITSKDDCKKLENNPQCFDVIKYEQFCKETPITEKCPDIKIVGLFPAPDLWCRLKEYLNAFFFPMKIALTVLGTFLSAFLVFITLKKYNRQEQLGMPKGLILALTIIVGIIIGVMIYVYFWIGLMLLLTLLILKIFI